MNLLNWLVFRRGMARLAIGRCPFCNSVPLQRGCPICNELPYYYQASAKGFYRKSQLHMWTAKWREMFEVFK